VATSSALGVLASTTTDWIGAIATATLGLVGVAITLWQWRASGFRPRPSAQIDPNRQAVRVLITNRGRGNGFIDHVAIIDERQLAVDEVTFKGFANGHFEPVALASLTAMSLIIETTSRSLPDPIDVVVQWASTRKTIKPRPVTVGLYGLHSRIPSA
jgi:hypothetical protein